MNKSREEYLEYRREYYQKNKEKMLRKRKQYYQENRDEILQYQKERREDETEEQRQKRLDYLKKYREERREYIDNIKLKRGCEECGYNISAEALQFDHIKPSEKEYNVSQLTSASYETIDNEIAKCRILCANCHSILTHSKSSQ